MARYITKNKHNSVKQSRRYSLKQKGGKFIDKGGFGCVVAPALKCSQKDKDKTMETKVSKIIRAVDNDISNELKISQILKKLDPHKKYYITFEKYCYINDIPEDRTDLVSVHYVNDELTKYSVLEGQLEKDKNACHIELSLKPVNLIMDYGGYSLSNIVRINRKIHGTKSQMHKLFVDNLRVYFKHLILGIVKMHFNRIVNRDIKPRNIMMNLNKETNQVQIRYIDFGLSDFLTTEYCSDRDNIRSKGTPTYIAPELIIAYVLRKYSDRSDMFMMKKIMREMEDNVKHSFSRINEKEMLGNLQENIMNLFEKIKQLFNNNKILPIYFGTEHNKFNGYLQKADVYALGLSIYISLHHYSNINVQKNKDLHDLLTHMIAIDPDKRYNAVQCLSHPYFQS